MLHVPRVRRRRLGADFARSSNAYMLILVAPNDTPLRGGRDATISRNSSVSVCQVVGTNYHPDDDPMLKNDRKERASAFCI